MSDVACVNEECPEYGVAKANPMGYPTAEIICGDCNGPVEDTNSDDTDS
jgi:hypothetical protein